MSKHEGIIYDTIFGIMATVISFIIEVYAFHSRDAFTMNIIIMSFVAGDIASFASRKIARKMNVRITL